MAVYFYAARLQAAFLKGFPHLSSRGNRCSMSVKRSPSDWDLSPDDDQSLVYEDGILVSGALPALVQHATPTAIYYPDTAYLFAFLLSARLFIKTHELLQRICDLGFGQQGLEGNDLATINKEHLGDFIPHMVQLLAEWSETFPYDFRDERMMEEVRTLTNRCITIQASLRRDVTQVLHNLLNKLTQLERYEENLSKFVSPSLSQSVNEVIDITELCPSPLVMAHQLTHIDSERMSYIGPEEFVQGSDADLRKTNNIESYVQWFNRLSCLVTWQSCSPVTREQKTRVGEYWIEVAAECSSIGNFNSLMAILTGLKLLSVSEHKKMWSKAHTAKLTMLEHQMDPSSNFSNYRSILRAAMRRSTIETDETPQVIIPFFSLFVKDMYFFSECCSDRSSSGHVKFDKFWLLAKQVTEFMTLKQLNNCSFEKEPEVISFLQTAPVLSESGHVVAASIEVEEEKK